MHWSLVEQELATVPEHTSSPPGFSEFRVSRSLVLRIMFCRSLFDLLAILLSVLLWFTDLVSSNSSYNFQIEFAFLNWIEDFPEGEITLTSRYRFLCFLKYLCFCSIWFILKRRLGVMFFSKNNFWWKKSRYL